MKISSEKSKEEFERDCMPNLPLTRPYFAEEELEEVKKVLESGWVSQGPKTKEFEDVFAKYVGAKYAVAVTIAPLRYIYHCSELA